MILWLLICKDCIQCCAWEVHSSHVGRAGELSETAELGKSGVNPVRSLGGGPNIEH